MYGLNVYLTSFELNKDLVKDNDKLLIAVTTYPEEMKAAIEIKASQMNNAHNSFNLNITSKTKEICFVFWKKSFFQYDDLIASTVIYANQFWGQNNNKAVSFDLLEPMHHVKTQERKVVGKIKVEFNVTEPYFPPDSKRKKLGHFGNVENPKENIWFDDGVYTYN